MRSQKERDPYRFYDVIGILGEGSMGSVCKVKKQQSAVGGSSRSEFVESERRRKWCFGHSCFLLFCPVNAVEKTRNGSLHTIQENSSIALDELPIDQSMKSRESRSSIIAFGRKDKDVVYALKTIHMSRARNSVYRKELLNEIAILQTLVRIFERRNEK
jgi:serine/threonine protein kinase